MTHALPIAGEPVQWVRPSALVLAELLPLVQDDRAGVARRACAALVGMSAPSLRPTTLRLAASLGYDWLAVGGALLDALLSSGRITGPDALTPSAVVCLRWLAAADAPAPPIPDAPTVPDAPAAAVSVPPAAAVGVSSDDPTPGLTCAGLPYPAWARAVVGERAGNRQAGVALWRAATAAYKAGPDSMRAWLDETGTARGFACAPLPPDDGSDEGA